MTVSIRQRQVNIARHQPEVKSYRQKWEFVDLISRINVSLAEDEDHESPHS